MARVRAQIGSKHPSSPFKLQVAVTSRGVFFDRILRDNRQHEEKLMVLHTTPKSARALARWILENVQA